MGSEMCIRDSVTTAARQAWTARHGSQSRERSAKACRIQMQVLASDEPYSEVPRDVQQTFIGQLADTSDPSTNSLPGTMNGHHSFECSTTPTPPIECEQ